MNGNLDFGECGCEILVFGEQRHHIDLFGRNAVKHRKALAQRVPHATIEPILARKEIEIRKKNGIPELDGDFR